MKPTSILSALFFFFALFFISAPLHAAASKGKGKTEIVITQTTSQHQLDSIKTAMAAQGIELDITMTIYSKTGQLKRISGTIATAEAPAQTFTCDEMGTVDILIKGKTLKVTSTPATTAAKQ